MIKKLVAICFCFFFMGTFALGETTNQAIVNVTIEGVPCPFCVNVLTKNLRKLSGVQGVKVDVDNHRFVVIMKPGIKPDLALISKTVKDSGYIPLKTEKADMKSLGGFQAHVEIKSQPCGMCHNK